MKNKSVTAVEWLIEQLQAPCRGIPSHIIEQAKEIEKEQIATAWEKGRLDTDDYASGEEYYDDRFKKKS